MKRLTFISTVLLTNIIFLLLHIHKCATITEITYTKQRYEKELQLLATQEQQYKQELCDLQDRKTVTRYAQKYLSMTPVTLQQVRTCDRHV